MSNPGEGTWLAKPQLRETVAKPHSRPSRVTLVQNSFKRRGHLVAQALLW